MSWAGGVQSRGAGERRWCGHAEHRGTEFAVQPVKGSQLPELLREPSPALLPAYPPCLPTKPALMWPPAPSPLLPEPQSHAAGAGRVGMTEKGRQWEWDSAHPPPCCGEQQGAGGGWSAAPAPE